MASTSSITTAMNNITLEDEEEGGLALEEIGGANFSAQNQEGDMPEGKKGGDVNQSGMEGGKNNGSNNKEKLVEQTQKFRLTGFYGEPNRARRHETWNLLRNLNTDSMLPWCIIGDMNNILNQMDKRGGRSYLNHLIQGFQSALDDCNLHDMTLEGYQFTWERGQDTDEVIEIRLDRALITDSFMAQFTEAKLTNLEISTSDHSPIFLEPVITARVISIASLCLVCNLTYESAAHVLVSCDFAKLCWAKVEFMRGDYNVSSFTEWFSEKVQDHNSDEFATTSFLFSE
ncbi:hypothetical protein POM88_014781 [Heracleum sosnowskyi]|uniref:Reverse transcriptase n=1 Tax=Heracleum sosnowskyi TaxID=360622 RepID=A0AAD8IK22_9APIA|nr:hypothetical protein POM88_014781 [Heracleum sosnowskyi]